MKTLKIAALSDVHGTWNKIKVPECDILISVGDYSHRGEATMVREYHQWLNKQDAGYIISIQGNHEKWVEKNFLEAKQIAEEACPGVYFIDEGLVEIEDIKIWGSSVTPWFHNWAWNRYRGEDIQKHWAKIPNDINILATHGGPYGILDEVFQVSGDSYYPPQHVGCEMLLKELERIECDLHFFGHLHGCGNQEKHINGISHYNVAICDDMYYPVNPVRIVEYER